MIRLISTDFDGTLHHPMSPTIDIPPELVARLVQIREKGILWVINTGRILPGLLQSLQSPRLPLLPDYIVAVEREIFIQRDSEFVPHLQWNRHCDDEHHLLFKKYGDLLKGIRVWLEENTDAEVYEDPWSMICITASHEQDADRVWEGLQELCRDHPELNPVRNSVYFRIGHRGFTKGTALSEIARLHNLPPSDILAVGDHFNDIPMLDPQHAACIAAPDNSIPEVKKHVETVGGYLSQHPYGYGVLDALNHFNV